MGQQLEMSVFDVGSQLVAKCTRHLAVRLLRRFVNVYFPAHAACVAAPRGDALEIVVKNGLAENHVIRLDDFHLNEEPIEAERRNTENKGKNDDKLHRMLLETVISFAVRKTPANDCTHEKGNEKDAKE
jgi:hypothetical protein